MNWRLWSLVRGKAQLYLLFLLLSVSSVALLTQLPRENRTVSAQQFLGDIPAELSVESGDIVHIRTEIYHRHGPAAEQIRNLGEPPEQTVQDIWVEFASPTESSKNRTILTDTAGTILQDTAATPGGGNFSINSPKERAERLEAQLATGEAKVVEQTADSLTVESIRDWSALFPEGQTSETGIAIPYVEDLKPLELIRQTTVRSDGMLLSSQLLVLTQDGDRVLIMSRVATLIETLEQAPDGIF